MEHARDVMEPAHTIGPTASIATVARTLLDTNAEGLCVVENGRLVGVLTEMDLVFREKRLDPPRAIVVLDLVLELGRQRTEREIERIASRTARELMITEVVSATPTTSLRDVASWMVERHFVVVPVLDGDRLVGVVTKRSIVVASLRALTERPTPSG